VPLICFHEAKSFHFKDLNIWQSQPAKSTTDDSAKLHEISWYTSDVTELLMRALVNTWKKVTLKIGSCHGFSKLPFEEHPPANPISQLILR
jgi:hypothetical protein